MKRNGFTLVKLLVVLVFVGGIGYLFVYLFGSGKSQARSTACANNLRQIGKNVIAFRAKKGGSSPRNLLDVVTKKDDSSLLQCPSQVTNKKLSGYAYRYLDKPQPDDVIAWDAQPEPWGNDLTGRAYSPRRNVLRADGTVKRMYEDEFQKLGLRGEVIKIK